MDVQKKQKINQLLQQHVPGTVLTQAWLEHHGYTRQLMAQYINSLWFERIGQGALIRKGDQVGWQGAVYALQKELELPIHIAGKSALNFFGFGHYVTLGSQQTLYLSAHSTTGRTIKLPKWFNQHDWDIEIKLTAGSLFTENEVGLVNKAQNGNFRFLLMYAEPERAILELLHLVSRDQSIEEAFYFMEGLTTLRSDVLQILLQSCQSYKVKRLFLLLAELCQHTWFSAIDLSKIDLGKGKEK